MISKLFKVFALLSILGVTNGFTVGRQSRYNSVSEQIMTALMAKSEMKEWEARVDEKMAPLFEKMELYDIMQLLGDYSIYMTLISQLAEAAGSEISAKHSEEKVLAAFEETLKKSQSEPFYERVENSMGKSDADYLLNLLKITLKEFTLPSEGNNLVET